MPKKIKTDPSAAAAAEARVAVRELAHDEAQAEARRAPKNARARSWRDEGGGRCADCGKRIDRLTDRIGTARGYLCPSCARASVNRPADLSPKPRAPRGRVPGPELDAVAQDHIAAMRGALTSARAALQLAQSHGREREGRGLLFAHLNSLAAAARRLNDAATYAADARRAAKKLHSHVYGVRA